MGLTLEEKWYIVQCMKSKGALDEVQSAFFYRIGNFVSYTIESLRQDAQPEMKNEPLKGEQL